MVDSMTINISKFVERTGIKISALSCGTGIPYGVLRRSIVRKERSLRASESMAICNFLQRDPFEFYHAGQQNDATATQDSA